MAINPGTSGQNRCKMCRRAKLLNHNFVTLDIQRLRSGGVMPFAVSST